MKAYCAHLIFGLSLGCVLSSTAFAGGQYQCSFKGVGEKIFTRSADATHFTDQKGKRFDLLENADFLQLRSADIDPDNINNPFTVYLIDKNTHRIRQISGAMRAAPMMADGICQHVKK
ncbi:MAG: hypothetical protein ACON4Q_00735 [Candidatus Puniceispirillaceae bacterium]